MNRLDCRAAAFALTLALCLPATAVAGPPLICHPFETGQAALLPWGDGSSWNTPDRGFEVRRLTQETLRLLSPAAPIIARMENMRRATIYAAQDDRVASELMSAVLARALASMAGGTPNPHALFDAGYLIESYKQAVTLHRHSLFIARDPGTWTLLAEPAADGYALVTRAGAMLSGAPEVEFAASLMRSGPAAESHRRRAAARAARGSLLAQNLAR